MTYSQRLDVFKKLLEWDFKSIDYLFQAANRNISFSISTPARYVLSRSAFSASFSWLKPMPDRKSRMPPIMSPDTLYRLPQGIRLTMQMVHHSPRSVRIMQMEYDHCSLLRILRIMHIPVMTGIPRHDRHIIGIRGYDRKYFWYRRFFLWRLFWLKESNSMSDRIMPPI